MRSSKPLTVILGEQRRSLDARLESGGYSSAGEVLRAGLRALDREDAALDAVLRAKVQEALDNRRPVISADEVFARLHKKHAERVTKRGL